MKIKIFDSDTECGGVVASESKHEIAMLAQDAARSVGGVTVVSVRHILSVKCRETNRTFAMLLRHCLNKPFSREVTQSRPLLSASPVLVSFAPFLDVSKRFYSPAVAVFPYVFAPTFKTFSFSCPAQTGVSIFAGLRWLIEPLPITHRVRPCNIEVASHSLSITKTGLWRRSCRY